MEAYNLSEDVQNQVKQLKIWIDQQNNLPQNIEERFALRFLHSCYYDMDKAKSTAQAFFEFRVTTPEVVTERDPLAPPIQKALKTMSMSLYRISGNRNLWVSQMNDPGLQYYEHILDAKFFFLCTDAFLLEDNILQESDYVMIDAKDVCFKFLMKINYSLARKLSKYQQEAMPVRLKQIHIMNTPSAMDRIYRFMKNFMSQEMTDLIHFHKPDSTTIFEYLSKEDLPADYGGSRETVAEAMTHTLALLMKHREHFQDDDFWRCRKTDENTVKESDYSIGID